MLVTRTLFAIERRKRKFLAFFGSCSVSAQLLWTLLGLRQIKGDNYFLSITSKSRLGQELNSNLHWCLGILNSILYSQLVNVLGASKVFCLNEDAHEANLTNMKCSH